MSILRITWKCNDKVKRYFYTDGMWAEHNRLFLASARWGKTTYKPGHLLSSLWALWQSIHCTWFQKVLRKRHELAAIYLRFKSLRFFSVGNLKDRVYQETLSSLSELKSTLVREVSAIEVTTLKSVLRSFAITKASRCLICKYWKLNLN